MSGFKKFFLKLQLPFLALQEKRVLNSDLTILVENSKMKDWITSKSPVRTKMWYPGAGTKVSKFSTSFTPHRNGHFVSVGRLDESRKGWDRLLLAYKEAIDLQVSLPDLVIIGSGSFSFETQRLVDQLTPHYPIKILGKLSDRDRDSKIQSASFFLQTSFEEGLGLAALEALRFGVPLICSETDGSREYVLDGISGKLVPQGEHFVNRFAIAINQSQILDYEKLSVTSKNLFDSVFAEELSRKRLLEIVNNSFSRKS
jgi:glycosyltransferase involved in cell wall biosynthesis